MRKALVEKPAASVDQAPARQPARHPVLALQRSAGNRAVQELVRHAPRRADESEADAISTRITSGATPRAAPAAAPVGDAVSQPTFSAIAAERGRGSPLPAATASWFEARLGSPLDDVRVHTGRTADRLSRSLDAVAFTSGSDIFFRAGERPAERLLAHELVHVVQQRHARTNVVQRQAVLERPAPLIDPPVIWGIDEPSRRTFMSVSIPGHTLGEVAMYAYGTPDAVQKLGVANPGLAEFLQPGTLLHLTGDPLSGLASKDLNTATSTGLILRGKESESASRGQGLVYTVQTAAGSITVTEGQFHALLRGLKRFLIARAKYIHDRAADGRWVQEDHVKGTSAWVRNVSDWLADNPPPYIGAWSTPERLAQSIVDSLEPVEPTADLIARKARQLELAAQSLDEAWASWHAYMEGTIAGAGIAIHRLELVRNTSFAIAAGIGGAVAAPAVFAAATFVGAGTATAVGAAVVAGTGTGAVIGSGLETIGALGGETVTAASGMGFDLGYVGERSLSGLGSGAVSGGLGAVGALAAPGIAGGLSMRLAGVPYGELGTLGRTGINVLTGAALGGPLGATGTAIQAAPAFARGEITGGQYGMGVLKGFGWGTALGGITSVYAPTGLYTRGGTLGYGGQPVTPWWMYASPWTPVRRPPGPEGLAGRIPAPLPEPAPPPVSNLPQRATIPPDDQIGFDLLVAGMRASGRTDPDIAARIAAMPPAALQRASTANATRFRAELTAARQTAELRVRATDPPLDPQLPNRQIGHPQGPDVELRYANHPPGDHEIRFGQQVHNQSGENVQLFGDTVQGTDYPGIDGTIGMGATQRPLSLKQVLTAPDAGAVRYQAQVAVESAQNAGYTHVEVHINAPNVTAAQVRATWRTPTAAGAPAPIAPVFNAPVTTARVVVHVRGGEIVILGPPPVPVQLGAPIAGRERESAP